MGSSGTKSKTPSKTESSKEKIQNEEPKHVSRKDPNISKKLSKEICRIVIETQKGKQIGTGFNLAFPIDLEWFFCLITN